MIAVFIILCYFHRFKVLKTSFLCDFIFAFVGIMFEVTNVGDVTDVTYFITEMFQITKHKIEGNCRTGVT